jgi:hypothetical protein
VFVLRSHLALIPVAAAVVAILGALRSAAFGVFPGSMAGGVIAAILIAALAVCWFGRLTKDTTTA